MGGRLLRKALILNVKGIKKDLVSLRYRKEVRKLRMTQKLLT